MISWFDAQGEMDLLQHATAGAAQRVHQSISTNHPPLQWVATRVEGGLQADGKRTDWKDVSFQAMTQEVGNATASSNRCTVAFAESEGLLWVAWEVTDADIVGAATIGRWDTQQCDSMALLLTPENEAARGRLTPGPASLRFEMVLPSENETNPLARCPVPGARVGWHREGDRVFLELALPMDELARVAGYRGKEWRVESVWQDRDRTGQVKWHSATGRRADIHVPARATLRWGGEATP